MRNSTFPILLFVVLGYAAGAQKLTLLPMLGIEKPFTKVSYNNLASFNPLECQQSRSLGVRMDYQLKKGYGPFVGLSTSRSSVSYNLTNPETGANDYTATAGKMQLQLQAGLQGRTKPIYFKKAAKAKPSSGSNGHQAFRSCGSYKPMNHCSGGRNKFQAKQAPATKGWFVSIIPSIGVAYNPFMQPGISSKIQGSQNTVTYNAGNFTTAVLTGVGLEFGNDTKRLFTVNINYYKGLGNNRESITTGEGVKPVTTNLSSKVSGLTASLGIPFSIGKKSGVNKTGKKQCEFKQYRSSCRRVI